MSDSVYKLFRKIFIKESKFGDKLEDDIVYDKCDFDTIRENCERFSLDEIKEILYEYLISIKFVYHNGYHNVHGNIHKMIIERLIDFIDDNLEDQEDQ